MTLICWIFSKETKNPAVELIIFFLKKSEAIFQDKNILLALFFTIHINIIRLSGF